MLDRLMAQFEAVGRRLIEAGCFALDHAEYVALALLPVFAWWHFASNPEEIDAIVSLASSLVDAATAGTMIP